MPFAFRGLFAFLVVASIASGAAAQTVLRVNAAPSRDATLDRADQAVRRVGANLAELTRGERQRWRKLGLFKTPLSFPSVVLVQDQGKQLNAPAGVPGDIVLRFATGSRSFPDDYRTLLQNVFDQVRPVANTLFGMPALGGEVVVSNFDADIGDRDAVAGGYYMPNNGSGEREIRFPVYAQSEAAAVNFVHCLLLAYQGTSPYGFDAFREGLVRAATMRAVRTPGALPATLDAELVENALDSSYDVGAFYDWFNQRALGGPTFIAPNLRDTLLPPGGSVGGLYLVRYQMAGTAWQKLLVENPGFIAEFNARAYAEAPASVPRLIEIGQAALDAVKGAASSKVEGLSFSDWFKRQHILSTELVLGPKLMVQPIPIAPEAGTSDFGVFDIAAHYFETQVGGNEALLSATAYPIFWDPDFNRVTPSAQDSTLRIAGGYDSVTPNFPDFFLGKPYRITADIPVFDRIARCHLPAGAVATGANPVGNSFFGTVTGLLAGDTAVVRVTFGGNTFEGPVANGAFGFEVPDSAFLGSQRLRVEVVKTTSAPESVPLRRFVNKGPGVLGLDLRIGGEGSFDLSGGLPKGITAFGLPIDPFDSSVANLLGLPANQVQLARYNPGRAAYDFFPNTGTILQGNGYFTRRDSPLAWSVEGRLTKGVRGATALRPGWNLVASPINERVPANRVWVVRATDPPKPLNEALGVELGLDMFTFVRGANDPVTGAPETGAWTSTSAFEVGQSVFVRVLVPEGVTLVFAPSVDGRGRSISSGPEQTGWRVRANVVDGNGIADVVIGQSKTGTPGFDVREDSVSPPAWAGLRAVLGDRKLYKDVRRLGALERYPMNLTGLVPGKKYRIDLKLTKGSIQWVKVVDPQKSVTRKVQLPGAYSFTPTTATYRIEFLAGGQQ